MHLPIFVACLLAGLAMAGPLDKKGIVWDIVTEYSYVTVVAPYVPDSSTTTTASSTRSRRPWKGHRTSSVPSELVTTAQVISTTTTSTVEAEPVITSTTTTPSPIVDAASTTSSTRTASETTSSVETTPSVTTTTTTESSAAIATTPAAPTTTTSSSVVVTTTTTSFVPPAATDEPSTMPTVINVPASQTPPAATPESLVDSDSADAVATSAMDGHNSHRPEHSAPVFTWNATLAQYALEATSCEKFAHILPNVADWGQNIYASFATSPDGFSKESAMANAARDWYDEISLFNDWGVASPVINEGWLHFTQMMWISSLSIGCAVQTCGTDNLIKPDWYVWYVTCNYFPVGNVIGLFDKNVKEF